MPSWLDFSQISDWVSGNSWSYLIIFTVAVIDAFFPLVPSETTSSAARSRRPGI